MEKTARRGILFLFSVSLTLLAPFSWAQEGRKLTLDYYFQSVDLSQENQSRLFRFLNARKHGEGILIQGFACDIGGFDISLLIAGQRARQIEKLISMAGIPPSSIRVARGIVLAGEPRTQHRRVELSTFREGPELENALTAANETAQKSIEIFYAKSGLKRSEEKPGFQSFLERHWLFSFAFAALGFLLFLFIIALIVRARFLRKKHLISEDEAEALEILTAQAALTAEEKKEDKKSSVEEETPEIPAHTKISPASILSLGKRKNEETPPAKNRSKNMAQKKQTKLTPISIRGAVDRQFEDKTLSELAKSPVHALEGLTPRHARLLEEGFGVKTLEDLAKLKYFEIAKAICLLAKYEK